ncbi:MAG: WG repeat-containing protein [Saprospiraceae bacterium]|nr:WG repeat-containing protein [Saprospiraceae bacterium]
MKLNTISKIILATASMVFIIFSPDRSLKAQDVGAEWVIKPNMTGFEEFIYHEDFKDMVVFTLNGKKGVANAQNKIIVPAEYERMLINKGAILISAGRSDLKRDDAYNNLGQKVNEGYEEFNYLQGGHFSVKKNGKWGVVDVYRKVLIEPEYDKIEAKSDVFILKYDKETATRDRVPMKEIPYVQNHKPAEQIEESPIPGFVKLVNKTPKSPVKYGFASLKGDTLVPPLYTIGECLDEGYAFLSQDGQKWGFVEIKSNKAILDFKYERPRKLPENKQLPLKADGKMGVVQLPEGKVILPFEYDNLDIAYRKKARAYVASKNNQWGIIEPNGNYLLPMQYDNINNASANLLIVKKDGLFGTWSPISEKLTEPVYKEIGNKNDSICYVKKDSLWALYHSVQAKELSPHKYDKLTSYGELFVGEYQEGGIKFSHLLRRDGQEVLAPENATIYCFENGTCFVKRAESAVHIDKNGKTLHEFADNTAQAIERYWISAKDKSGQQVFIHSNHLPGKEIWLESLGELSEALRACKFKGKYGYMNDEGAWVVKPVFDNALNGSSRHLRVKYNGKWGVLKNPTIKK